MIRPNVNNSFFIAASLLLLSLFILPPEAQASSTSVDRRLRVEGQCVDAEPPWPQPQVLTTPPADYKAPTLRLLDRLIAMGFRKFGDLDLIQFRSHAANTEIEYRHYVKFVYSNGTERSAACWSVVGGVRKITVNRWMWYFTDEEDRALNPLHEFLESEGWDDRDHQASAAMNFLVKARPGTLEPEQIPALRNLTRNYQFASSGSITGVGGGGDWMAAKFRRVMYDVGYQRLSEARTPEEREYALQWIRDIATWTIETKWK